jgi:large subunit ribosomal protein L35
MAEPEAEDCFGPSPTSELDPFYETSSGADSGRSPNIRFSVIPAKMGIRFVPIVGRLGISTARGRIIFCEPITFRGDEKTMPKLKSNRGAAKRLKATGSGKIKHYKAFGSHLLTHKTTKRKRNLRGSEVLNKQDTKNMKRLLPYL